MYAVGSELNRPYIFAPFPVENLARKIVSRSTKTPFTEESDTFYFTSGEKTPQGVKRNIQVLQSLGLGEHSTVRQFIKASIAKAKRDAKNIFG